MSTARPNPHRRVIIEFEPGSQPINGVIREQGLAPHPFSGWLELMVSLEAVSGFGTAPAPPTARDAAGADAPPIDSERARQ
jgi:hypothetical protein